MSKHSMNSISLVAVLAAAVFVVAFFCLMFIGDYRFMASFFMAFLIALLTAIVLYLGLGTPTYQTGSVARTGAGTGAGLAAAAGGAGASARSSAAEASEAAAGRKAAAEAEAEAARAAEAARKAEEVRQANADSEAERRAESEAETARKAAADAEAETARKAAADAEAEAARKAAADAEAEAARKAAADAEAARVADAEAARTAAQATPAAVTSPSGSADLGEDYDGDGVREGVHEGTRPAGLDAPRGGQADDLKQIKGIGPKMEKLCNSLGFWHFDQVASWSSDEVAWVDANLQGFKGRVTRDEWVAQAGILATGGTTEFAKRVEDGGVY